ncbi:hypothetical protein [Achromobacter aloeverae]|uniref:Uncharacterized protein n=1 Tax=Achromobacter aloeverae TaxID=1750518 RepID=A0A4V1MS24_9BURK|nr:hypothetical protein [Achromobacter aloeverae]RXN87990.1 hypothetical protein C7R54_15550 [Achromobacter aloeverae]
MTNAHYSDILGMGSSEIATWFHIRKLLKVLVVLRGVSGWQAGALCDAVTDDFGNLVKVA